jgi:4'-phosphopantetheinyl transferase
MDEVRVRLVRDDVPPGGALAGFAVVLDAHERRRAAGLLNGMDRRRYATAHAALRFIAGASLGAPPRELRWECGPHGKPALCGPWTGVEVSLSHSGGLSPVAVSAARRVGVDIQRLHAKLDVTAMARRFLLADEASFVAAECDSTARAERFGWLWVRKEAVVKVDGGRLIPQGMAVRARGAVCGDGSAGPCRVADLPAPEGFRAAVALSGGEPFHAVCLPFRWPTGTADSSATGSSTSIAAAHSVSEPGS